MSTQLQILKEEDDTSSNKFSLRDYLPSYNVESKPSEKKLQTPKETRNIFEEKPWEPKPKHDFDFTPLGRSYESTLEELLQRKLIVLPKVTSEGLSFISNYCAYHRHNRHETSDCMELKNQIQDLIDDGDLVVDVRNMNADHKDFKEPFPTYDKGESSKTQTHHKVNYTYSNDDNVINMIEPMDVEF